MGCRILHDREQDRACLYCSTTETAFGPVFYAGEDGRDAREAAEAFLRWIDTYTPRAGDLPPVARERWRKYHDPRSLTDEALEYAHTLWREQEKEQYEREAAKDAEP